MKKIKIARIATVPIAFTHILDLLEFLNQDERFELHIVCSEGEFLKNLKDKLKNTTFHTVLIPRDINPIQDLKALIALFRLFRSENFDIIHSYTPKAGLLSALAGFIAGSRVRLHSFTGQVWANLTGFRKSFLVFLDKVISWLNSCNYTDSIGQRKILIENGVGTDKNLLVIHKGSLGGINAERFSPDRLQARIEQKREELFSQYEGKVLLYLGRLNKDKGIKELWSAFQVLRSKYKIKLLLVGPVETLEDISFKVLIDEMMKSSDVSFVNFTPEPEIYLGLCDIFCFPSYREGFGTVALEAAAMEKPVVASNIYGLSDAVENGKSGLLFEVYNSSDLTTKLEILLNDEEYANSLGRYGRERVLRDFTDKILTEKMISEYFRLLKRND